MHLFGFASDLERAELLFTSLLVQAAYGLAAAPVPAREHAAAYRRSWLVGFASAVSARLREAEARAAGAAAAGGASMALVLADRSGRVAERLAQTYPRVRTAGPRRLAGGGMSNGYAAGRAADLGGSSVGADRPARGVSS